MAGDEGAKIALWWSAWSPLRLAQVAPPSVVRWYWPAPPASRRPSSSGATAMRLHQAW